MEVTRGIVKWRYLVLAAVNLRVLCYLSVATEFDKTEKNTILSVALCECGTCSHPKGRTYVEVI